MTTRPHPSTLLICGSLLSVLISLLSVACGGGAAQQGAGGEMAPPVEAVPARSGTLPLEEQLSGVVRALDQVAIRPEITAPVIEVLVRSGEAVRRGQPLVRLDDAALREQLRQAEANLRLVQAAAAEERARLAEIEAQVVRTRALAESQLVSELELETQEAQLAAARAGAEAALARVEQARATADERRAALARTVVRAPVSGHVGQRNAEVGMVADPGATLFLVGGLDRLVVEVPLPQDLVGRVAPGTPVEIATRRAAGAPVQAAIARISPFLEPASFSTMAEVDVPGSAALQPGMLVTVRVLYGASERATLVPTSCLWEDPGSGIEGVFVVEDAAGLTEPATPATEIPPEPRPVVFRAVDVLAEGRGRVGVGGVAEGEWVVTVGQHLLHERLQTADGEAAAAGRVTARVRPTTWERVLELQGLQREDLLEGFLAKQRVLARALGAELPESEAVVEEVLAGSSDDRQGSAPGTR